MATLKLYLTSLEPNLNQTVYSQSIGGYVSNSLVYPETTLSSTIGLYDTSLSLATPSSGSWSEWQGIEYINIGNELIKIPSFVNGSIVATQRAYNNIYNVHLDGDIVRAIASKELLNDVFNDSYKQYRCVAIKNVSTNSTDPSQEQVAYDLEVFIKQNSRNVKSDIKIALEKPSSEYISGVSTSWSTLSVVDSLLINAYEEDYFKEAYLKITSGVTSGQGKIIKGFATDTGTFTFYDGDTFSSSLDFSITPTYEVLPSPSQRVKTGIISPDVGSSNVTQFFNPDEFTTLTFFEQASVFNVSNLSPNDVMYVWIERTIEKGNEEFLNNDFILNLRYKVSE
jgi:hypothetical protein